MLPIHMKISSKGTWFIQNYEKLRLQRYRDSGGLWTIGWGRLIISGEPKTCTRAQADAWFLEDLQEAESAVRNGVVVPLTQNQYDALVSLVFNIGVSAFKKSTIRRLLNKEDYVKAADQFDVWVISGGKRTEGLVKRRAKEKIVFKTPDTPIKP